MKEKKKREECKWKSGRDGSPLAGLVREVCRGRAHSMLHKYKNICTAAIPEVPEKNVSGT
jgi:hypothetical protein